MFIYRLILEQVKRGYLMEELLKELVEKTGNLQQMVMLLIIFLNLIKLIKCPRNLCYNLRWTRIFAGDYNTKFTIQSISKIISLMLAILDNGEEYVFQRLEWNQVVIHLTQLENLKHQVEKTLQSYDKCRSNSCCFYDKRKR